MGGRLWRTGLGLVLALALSSGVLYAERPTDDVDPLALAALLISDGRWDKAAAALAEVDPNDKHLDRARSFTQLGLIARHEERWADAANLLNQAINAGATDPNLRLMLAQAELKADAPAKALNTLNTDRAALDSLGGLDRSLLAKAFRGELVPQDPSDEPASVHPGAGDDETERIATASTRPTRKTRSIHVDA